MILLLFHVIQILLYFVVEKLQYFYIGNCIPKEPPGPTAIFQGTFKNHPEAPKEPQGAPKSSQGAPRDLPGALKSPSFCPASSLRNPRGPSSTARELPRYSQGPPSSTPESFLLPIVLLRLFPRPPQTTPRCSQTAPRAFKTAPRSPRPPQVYRDSAPRAPTKSVDTQSFETFKPASLQLPKPQSLQASEPPSLQVSKPPSCQASELPSLRASKPAGLGASGLRAGLGGTREALTITSCEH